MTELEILAPGLYIVATPIGNLEDITLRALRVLRSVDRIACEDTRQTQKLLNHFNIDKPSISYHLHNERERGEELIAALKEGGRIALVSDAGMPGISDPGGWLVGAAIAAGIPVHPIGGINAALTALVASGLSSREFLFLGFPPEKSGARRSFLEGLAQNASTDAERTFIFYEAPHRIAETLSDLQAIWGPSLPVVVARELTKLHEEFVRGTVAEVAAKLANRERIRGEITLLVASRPLPSADAAPASLTERVRQLQMNGLDEKDALKHLAKELGKSKSELYRELQRTRSRR